MDSFWGCVVPKRQPKQMSNETVTNILTREKILGIKDSKKFIANWTQDEYEKRATRKDEPNEESKKLKRLLDTLLMPPPVSK